MAKWSKASTTLFLTGPVPEENKLLSIAHMPMNQQGIKNKYFNLLANSKLCDDRADHKENTCVYC